MLGLGAVGTLAYWTDSVAITGGTFSAGHLDLQVNNSDAPPPVTSLAMSNMAPGESVAATFTVQNKGTVDFTYSAKDVALGAPFGGATVTLASLQGKPATAEAKKEPCQACLAAAKAKADAEAAAAKPAAAPAK